MPHPPLLAETSAWKIIDHGLSLGADFVELFIERTLDHSLLTLKQKVQSIDSGIDFGVGIRLLYGTKVLYGYTNQACPQELMRIINDLAAKDLRDPCVAIKPLSFVRASNLHPVPASLSVDPMMAEKIAFLSQADSAATTSSSSVTQTRGMCYQRQQTINLFNSEGLAVADERHYIRTTLTAIASDKQQQTTGMFSAGALSGWSFAATLDATEMGEQAARQACVNLSAQPCPSGRMPVVIGNGFGGVIFHEACGHLLETTAVAKKASVFHDKLDQMIANPVVNAVDDGTIAHAWGSLNVDDEGMATQKTQLIKDGRLSSFLVDRVGSTQTGYARTGSGRRESYQYAPASRMRNTFIEPGSDHFDDMIASIDYGIYAAQMGGGSVQPGTGEFNFAVTEGYLIEKGRIKHPVKSATLISTGPQVLQEISMVGKDFKLACGMCGSVSGSIPTTVGQPTIKVDDLLVGGQDA